MVRLILTGKCIAGHMEGDIRDSTTKQVILNSAIVLHMVLVLRKVPGRTVGLTILLFCCSFFFFFSQQARVAEELDMELLPCISHRISSFRAKVLRRKQILT